mgnify:CR=1 FL=1
MASAKQLAARRKFAALSKKFGIPTFDTQGNLSTFAGQITGKATPQQKQQLSDLTGGLLG